MKKKDKLGKIMERENKIEKVLKNKEERSNTGISEDYIYLTLSEYSLKENWLSPEEEKARKDL